MATLTIRLSDEKHERLRQLAERRKISMNKLLDELSARGRKVSLTCRLGRTVCRTRIWRVTARSCRDALGGVALHQASPLLSIEASRSRPTAERRLGRCRIVARR